MSVSVSPLGISLDLPSLDVAGAHSSLQDATLDIVTPQDATALDVTHLLVTSFGNVVM